jgi:hypothetical protein
LHAQANTLVTPALVNANASSFLSIPGDNTFGQNSASGTVERKQSFTVDGPGAFIFSLPYQLSLQASDFSSQAQVRGTADFVTPDGTPTAHGEQTFTLSPLFGGAPQSGSLTFGVVAGGPGTLNLDFQANTNVMSFGVEGAAAPGMAAVPEPSALAGLCAGLFALAGVARRRLASR